MTTKIKVRKLFSHSNRSNLFVDGLLLGQYIASKDKVYLKPLEWAKKQTKKRKKVVSENIIRLEAELKHWKHEQEFLNNIDFNNCEVESDFNL